MPAPLVRTTGRRKSSVARVDLREGSGAIIVNGKSYEEYFTSVSQRSQAAEPLKAVDMSEAYDIEVNVTGGGLVGQAGALRLGIARALAELDPEFRPKLKSEGFLTRDSRKKESKKYGLKKARKAPQYSKR